MRKRVRLAVVATLGGLLVFACSLPKIINTQMQEILNTGEPPPSPTQVAAPSEVTASEGSSPSGETKIHIVDQVVAVESESPAFIIEGTWPNLQGPDTKIKTFNKEVNRLIEEVQEEFLAAVNEQGPVQEGRGQAPISSLRFDYAVTDSDGRSFSFFLTFDQYVAVSVHPFPFSHALTYDAQQGEMVHLEDLFLPGTDPILEIGEHIDPILTGRGFGYEAGQAVEVMQQRENWNLFPEGLQINFDVYEVGPYAAGLQSVLLPWESLTDLLDPEGLAGDRITP
jgi:hypothetical protein